MPCTIYGLYDPARPDIIRYVGYTSKLPAVRLTEHIVETRHFYKKYGRGFALMLINAAVNQGASTQLRHGARSAG